MQDSQATTTALETTQSAAPAAAQAAGDPAAATSIFDRALNMLEQHGPAMLGVLLLMIAALVFSRWARGATRRALLRTKFDPTLAKFLSNMLRWVILVLALLTSLNVFGITATSFAAVIGAVTLAIGLGFQSSLSNLAAGVMLLIFRPFKVGDMVNIGGQFGKVNEIDLLMTEIDTPDGRRVILPNNQIFGAVIENVTHHPRRRVDIPVGVHYDADIDQTRAALEKGLKMVQPRLDDPPTEVILQELGASSVNWTLRVWTKREDFFATRQATIRAAKYALEEAGITIPYPQMDVHLRMVGEPEARTVRLLTEDQSGAALPRS